jgi:HMG (high mobility group) box
MADLKTLMINLMEEQAAVLMKHLQRLKGDGSETVPLPPVEKIEEVLKKGKKKKEPVDPNKPKKPSSAYILYMSENQAPFKAANPSSTQTEVMTTLGNRWTTLPVEAKAKYVKQAEIRKELYEMKMAVYAARDPNSSGSIPVRKSPIKTSVTAAGVADAPTIVAPPAVPPTPIVSVSEIIAPASAESEKEMRKRKRRALREAEAAAASVAQPVAVSLPPIVQETFVPESEKKKVHHCIIHYHNINFFSCLLSSY